MGFVGSERMEKFLRRLLKVFRFEDLPGDFERKLGGALETPPDYDSAAAWRDATAWAKIAEATASAYEDAIRAR